jgi:hypothetical protein
MINASVVVGNVGKNGWIAKVGVQVTEAENKHSITHIVNLHIL